MPSTLHADVAAGIAVAAGIDAVVVADADAVLAAHIRISLDCSDGLDCLELHGSLQAGDHNLQPCHEGVQ